MLSKKITIIENSDIIRKGIISILRNHSLDYEIVQPQTVTTAWIHHQTSNQQLHILIVNPSSFDNSMDRIRELKQDSINYNFKVVALVYAYFDEQIISVFDEVIYINDDDLKIINKLKNLFINLKEPSPTPDGAILSQREMDVIRLVALGYSNKEIGTELCISIHTVVSHRKNITSKLGIKSASGLTIYAVINKLISFDDFDQTN